jgi:hypothetical protein
MPADFGAARPFRTEAVLFSVPPLAMVDCE